MTSSFWSQDLDETMIPVGFTIISPPTLVDQPSWTSSRLISFFSNKTQARNSNNKTSSKTISPDQPAVIARHKNIMNLSPQVPEFEFDDNPSINACSRIHLRIQPFKGKKSKTLIDGLPNNFNFKKAAQMLSKSCNCGSSILENTEKGTKVLVLN